MNIVVCIPARYESSRFPAKILANETGKYLIQHTYEQAIRAKLPSQVLIATDDERIQAAADEFGAPCVMTSKDHQSGTDRIAEAVADVDADIIVNLQGDEPEIDPDHIDLVAQLLIEHPESPMATLGCPMDTAEQVNNPNIVKVITGIHGQAIYFSRSVIPYNRDAEGIGIPANYHRHIGMYAYRKEFLLTITQECPTPLERTEKLEQLRVLEHGHSIQVGRVTHRCDGIDTPEQYQAFVNRMKNNQI